MNVALPALVLFFLVLPGFVFRSRFKRAERSALDYAPFGRVVAEAVLWASVLHALWLGAAWLFAGRTLRLDLLLDLVSSAPNAQAIAIAAVGQQSGAVLLYFASLLLACFAVPTALRWLITARRLDRAGHWLAPVARFHDAPWYYLLTGADFKADELPDLIQVSAIVDVASTPYLYTGFLDHFFVNPDGGLDRLVLQGVARRLLSNDRLAVTDEGALAADEEFYPIEGDYFVLRYAEAITLNIQYLRLQDQAEAVSAVEETAPQAA